MSEHGNTPGEPPEASLPTLPTLPPPTTPPPTQHVLVFRAALRHEKAATRIAARDADAIVENLIGQMSRALLPYADHLVKNSELRGQVDGSDLIQEAWLKVMRYLAGPGGDRVQDDLHLLRLLRVAMRSRLLDFAAKYSAGSGEIPLDDVPGGGDSAAGGMEAWHSTPGERLRAPDDNDLLAVLPDALQWGIGDGRYINLIAALFTGEKEFHAACANAPRRKPKHYQSFVLCQLGSYLQVETLGGGDTKEARAASKGVAALMRTYIQFLGVPRDWWEQVEAAAINAVSTAVQEPGGDQDSSGPHSEIIAAANRVCGTNIKDRSTLAVLRYEFNHLI